MNEITQRLEELDREIKRATMWDQIRTTGIADSFVSELRVRQNAEYEAYRNLDPKSPDLHIDMVRHQSIQDVYDQLIVETKTNKLLALENERVKLVKQLQEFNKPKKSGTMVPLEVANKAERNK